VQRQPLERDLVVRTALRLLDEVGLDGLTLRKLAAELGVQAPALYWHFANKQELLDHMATAIADEARAAILEDGPWDERLVAYARGNRRALLSHRDGARVVAGNRPVDSMLPTMEHALANLVEAGFTPGEAMRSLVAIGTFVGGFVTEEQAEARRNADEGWTEEQDMEAFQRLLETGELPTLVAALAETGDPNGDATFEHGLKLIIDGMRATLDHRRERPSP
jgi:TetR/AcrR family tetracycline transcriptional repressor